VLKRGLLVFAGTLPNGAPEFRYVYHEVIEEAQHSLMFQEFVNRTGIDIAGMPPRIELASRMVVSLARRSPARFFLFVLGGEDPIDDFQRDNLRSGDLHPLLERIMRIHVTEEARHLSFARAFLRRQVPALSRRRRFVLSLQTPVTLGAMVQLMLRPSPQLVRRFSIPPEVLREAYGSQARAEQRRSLRKVRKLCVEVGLVNPLSRRLWRAFGIWDEDLPR
jgi:hypothetical protein